MAREEIWNKAEQRLYELYGEYPDLCIVNRFLSEKMALAHFGVAEYFDELAGICRESIEKYNEKLSFELFQNILSQSVRKNHSRRRYLGK